MKDPAYLHQAFWLVWGEQPDRPPTYQHTSYESARAEAERLARNHPGDRFVVVESVCAVEKVDVREVDLRPSHPVDARDDPDPLPF